MKRLFRILLCCVVSFLFLWIVCYALWSYKPSEGEMWLAFIGSTLVLTALAVSLWELCLKQKTDTKVLSDRIIQLEAQGREMRAEIEALSDRITQLESQNKNKD